MFQRILRMVWGDSVSLYLLLTLIPYYVSFFGLLSFSFYLWHGFCSESEQPKVDLSLQIKTQKGSIDVNVATIVVGLPQFRCRRMSTIRNVFEVALVGAGYRSEFISTNITLYELANVVKSDHNSKKITRRLFVCVVRKLHCDDQQWVMENFANLCVKVWGLATCQKLCSAGGTKFARTKQIS